MPVPDADTPPHRYDAALAAAIESRWQDHWEASGAYETPNPAGALSTGRGSSGPKLFVMDMFPYPSGSGLHVGHPLGYIATDVYVRFKRMAGFNVLYTMGFDAFGLPAEEHARQTGQHPRINTEANIDNMRRQLDRLGLGHDKRRGVATTDIDYYRWTQWIFLQIFNSWFDPGERRARPIAELVDEFSSGRRPVPDGRTWEELSEAEQREVVDSHRLAYVADAPVNWCPALGTVLANEEVTNEGRSERGNHEVFKRPLKQWMMRITAYADRLLEDLDLLDWPESVKTMQRNWIGRSEGALISFPATSSAHLEMQPIEVFTTRPDTLFGTTYMVLAPEHPLVDELVADAWPAGVPELWTGGAATPREAVAAYRARAAELSDADRSDSKSGIFLGHDAVVPFTDTRVPVFIADYVLMGYGTGAVMGVPGEDQRDREFAEAYSLPVIRTVEPPPDHPDELAYTGDGPSINSRFLDGLDVEASKVLIIERLTETGFGRSTVNYRMRDWLFSRQRYWGEPIPIVFDDYGPVALPDDMLPLELPELTDWAPRALARDSEPEPPLGRVTEWVGVDLDLGDGPHHYRRELNTMPQWAGSCWYYLRYLDPTNDEALVDPDVESYWMADPDPGGVGGVDLYVGGVEHAVLHLLYARFWHKVLYDLGHVSGLEPFKRLINQGYIQAYAFKDDRGVYVAAEEVEGSLQKGFRHDGQPVTRELGKMGKSLKNSVTPDDMYASYGADTLRLYEMFMGPIDQDRPWETRSVVGSQRVLQRVWRNVVDEETGELRIADEPSDDDLLRLLHRTIDGVRSDMEGMRFNTAIAKLTELNNELTRRGTGAPREVAAVMVRMLAPLVPHFAEELWHRLHGGGADSVMRAEFPAADPALLVEDIIEVPVQVNGKVRGRVRIAADADEDTAVSAALAEPNVAAHVGGRELRKQLYVSGRMITLVV
ncbi:MAG: leucine--tRNA ligase [Acidimicrobiaceae bacterium]|nr:leucine--tRNA ligase [Acidimicrobiaceae bacterium]MDE0516834.1 leucine--tRNA ligase [Acidimicrobiaceae bacterium]MDE0657300.1 leucine--tRNA ligase [Acidimicrobiaceae bacterium]MXZ96127.1 leucine--tRNA ligase [Acidimicrobiaceae bacterium]MYF43618.1 leucine--tRNA ligase [Acidimicrobiaceae bacterium]